MIPPRPNIPKLTKTIPVMSFKSLRFLIRLRVYIKRKNAKPKIVEKITRPKSKNPTKNNDQNHIIHDP